MLPINITPNTEKNIDTISKIAANASKFGIVIGGMFVILYSLKIDHFPQDLSIGDSILFAMAAICFGIIYTLFIGCLLALGIFTSPATKYIGSKILTLLKKFKNKSTLKSSKKIEFAPFDANTIAPSFIALALILALGQKEHTLYFTLPIQSLGLYIFYSLYRACGIKIKEINSISNSPIEIKEKNDLSKINDLETLKKAQLFFLAFTYLFPLLFGGIFGQLLETTMRVANVRVEKCITYIKEPYSSLIPNHIANAENPLKDYKKFNDVKILLKGFGKTTVIEYSENGLLKKLEIPNDQIIIQQ